MSKRISSQEVVKGLATIALRRGGGTSGGIGRIHVVSHRRYFLVPLHKDKLRIETTPDQENRLDAEK